jgi:hypothetical protein
LARRSCWKKTQATIKYAGGIMMDPLVVVAKIQKMMRENLQRVGDAMISGGVDNMEKYQYMLGQARTYQYLLQEISNLLEEKEQKDEQGNVIDIGKGNSKT